MADETTNTDDTTDAPAADVDTGDVTPTDIPAGDTEDAPATASDPPAATADVSAATADVPPATADVPAATADVPAPAADEPAPTEAEETEAPDAGPEPVGAPAGPRAQSVAEARREKNRLARALRQRRSRARSDTPGERRPITRVPKPEAERGRRQERRGVVVSDAMDKTIVVKVDVTKVHQRYKKVIRRSTKFHAHDERNLAKVGDVVRIVETRPLSATKNWRLAEIVEEAK